MADTVGAASTFVWNSDALISSMVGALIGGTIALIAVFISHKLRKDEAIKRDTMHTLGVLQAIYDEIETLWETYLLTAGNMLESLQEGKALAMYWPVNQDYFTVYKSNAVFIGKIKNRELRKQIVATYTAAKSLIDSYALNNNLVQKWEDANNLYLETDNRIHEENARAYYQTIVEYTVLLHKGHNILKSAVSELLYSLKNEGVST